MDDMGNSAKWILNAETLLVLSTSPIWKSFVEVLSDSFPKDPLAAAHAIFETKFHATGITWESENDVLADLFMNMGGGIPYEVLIEVRRCARVTF
jgi:hypothetical protein